MTNHKNGQELNHKVHSVTPTTTMLNAYKLMHEKGIRHLPVLDAGRLVGIVSERDALRASSCKVVGKFNIEIVIDDSLLVEQFMSWPVFTVGESTSINKAAEIMLEQRISSVVVENDYGQIRGIITTDDVLKHLLEVSHKSNEKVQFPLSYILY